jgi:hypothetical protein
VKTNDNGLPLPGRELDAWIAEHCLGYTDVHETNIGWIGRYPTTHCLVPISAVSTTHAFFKVMEEARGSWDFYEWPDPDRLAVFWHRLGGIKLPVSTEVILSNYPSREHAYAHTVCCCTWKAKSRD